ncbi:DUF479 domain-containing protein [Thalassotalea sp. M1531]|uniref:DUF479 domain-containing protein n=1 Tax=Thalassotalea algicola TaxID=2716224 RepID=A0A7Y0LGM5_9GAMM|nr:ACP phosphodiesterase [Thalassotalea algicola]NMP33316.1 DUF479 domain-containing protein [Thalassotalea algicola]
MNYLAHLLLSPNISAVRIGNLMGDFIKGNQLGHLPEQVLIGIHLHRAIDKFTDNHEQVRALKLLLSSRRKRFSGIISDIVFDHLLAKNWQAYSDISLETFANQCYHELSVSHQLMPERMANVVSKMTAQNWLLAYQSSQSISGAINGVSRRIRFENNLLGAADEVMPVLDEYQQAFLTFFPELQRFVEQKIDELL